MTGWIRKPRTRLLATGVIVLTLLLGLADQQTNDDNPRLYDFRGAIDQIQEDRGPQEPGDLRAARHALRARVLRARAGQPAAAPGEPKPREGSPVFVLASFQDNKRFFDRTNKVVGKLDFHRRLRAALRQAADQGVGVPMSSRPWDVRLQKVTWEPVPSERQRPHARAHHGRSSGCPLAVWYFGWLLNPDRIGNPILYGILIAAELFNLTQALRLLVDVRQRAGAKAEGAERAAGRGRVRARLQGAGGHRGPDRGRGRGPARRRGPGLGAGRRQRRRHARPGRAPRRGLHPPRRAHRREGGQHQQRARADRRAVHRRVRLGSRGRPHVPRGHARAHGGPEGRVRPDAAVLREHRGQPGRRRILGPAGAVLRRDRPRQGRARRRVLLRHQRALPPYGVRERGRLSHQLAHRGLRALDPPPREGLEVRLPAGRAVARARAGGHGGLRVAAAALGPGLPVGATARAAGAPPVATQGAVPALGLVLPLRLDGAHLHELPGGAAALRRPAARRHRRSGVPAALRALLRHRAHHGRARRRGRVHLRGVRARGRQLLDPRAVHGVHGAPPQGLLRGHPQEGRRGPPAGGGDARTRRASASWSR